MAYYMRYFVTDHKSVSLADLEAGLPSLNPAYSIRAEGNTAELFHGDGLYGVIEINRPGDGLFDEEVADEIKLVEDNTSTNREKVIHALKNATLTIAVQVVYQDRDAEVTFDTLNALWGWLFANYHGVLQADGDGYYDQGGKLLETGWN